MTTKLLTIDHAHLGAVTGGYPSGFDPPGKQYRGDQWSDYLNPNAGKVQGYDATIDRGMSRQPDNPGMDQDIIGSPPPIAYLARCHSSQVPGEAPPPRTSARRCSVTR